MDVEITPEPTEQERAAIEAAVAAHLASSNGSAWWLAGLPEDEETLPEPDQSWPVTPGS